MADPRHRAWPRRRGDRRVATLPAADRVGEARRTTRMSARSHGRVGQERRPAAGRRACSGATGRRRAPRRRAPRRALVVMSPNAGEVVRVEVDDEAVRAPACDPRRKPLGLHRPLDPALELDGLQARSEQPRGRALEEAFEEPLDGGQRRHGRSGSLAEGPSDPERAVASQTAAGPPAGPGDPGPAAVGGARLGARCGILSPLFGRSVRSSMSSAPPGGPMPEILTESFCERCGTRYTFESAQPQDAARLKGVKVVSRGLKNFVMSRRHVARRGAWPPPAARRTARSPRSSSTRSTRRSTSA